MHGLPGRAVSSSTYDRLNLRDEQISELKKYVKGEELFEKKAPPLVLNTLDFAGQPEYKPMHHCFILSRGLFLMVFKIPDMIRFIEGNEKHNPMDDVSFWVRSINAHIHSAEDGSKAAKRILLVGTHCGSYPLESLRKIDEHLKKELIDKDRSRRYTNLIHTMVGEPEYFIPVENSIDCQCGDSYRQDSGIKLVQDTVMAMSKSLPFLVEEYPHQVVKI